MIKVQIESTEVEVKQGTSQRSGKAYSIREQDAWGYFTDPAGKPHPHPQRIRITLGDEQQPYATGSYIIAPSSLYPDRFGQVTTRAKLIPLGDGLAMLAAFIRANTPAQAAVKAA